MKRVFRQWLAGLLSVVLLLTLLPATALAEEAGEPAEHITVQEVQALIDELPDAESITDDNRADVEAQLNAIDEVKLELTDDEMVELDITRYLAAVDALLALDDMAGADIPKTIAFPGDLTGDGKENSPYLISTPDQLKQLSEYVENNHDCKNMFFKLTANIDLGGDAENLCEPIGLSTSNPFNGSFDGGFCSVSGFYRDGLFGYIGESGEVKNLTVEGEVSGDSYIGGIAGQCYGRIEHCTNNAKITGQSNSVGGIVGKVEGSASVQNCVNNGVVSGQSSNVGGIVGEITENVTISGCENTGTVSGKDDVGGIVGSNKGTVKDCYNTGDISCSTSHIGGVVGYSSKGTTGNCYNTGTVTGSSNYVGGVVGYGYNCTTENCYNTGTVTGNSEVGGVVGANYGATKNCYNTGTVIGSSEVGGVVVNLKRYDVPRAC